MTSRSSAYVTALSIAMVAGGLISLHIFRNLSAASASDAPAPVKASRDDSPAKSSGPLYESIADNDTAALARILASHPDLELPAAAGAKPDTAPQDGRTALMHAATANRPASIALLAEAGASIDARDVHSRTALMHAA